MSDDYPLKPTEADLDQESVDRQEAVMAWQSEEPVRTFTEPETRDKYRAALERLAKIDPLVEDNLPFIDPSRELEARIRFAEAALKDGA